MKLIQLLEAYRPRAARNKYTTPYLIENTPPPTPPPVKGPTICAWCKKLMKEGDPKLPPTHSICPECEKKYMEESA